MSTLVERLEAAAEEVMEFPHPSHCDHLHRAHEVMSEAAAALRATGEGEWVPQVVARLREVESALRNTDEHYALGKACGRMADGLAAAPTPAEPLEREVLDFITMVPEDRTHKLLVARGWTPPAEPTNPGETSSKVVGPLRDAGAVAWQFKDSEWTEWATITEVEYDAYRSGKYTGSGNSFEVRALYAHPAPQQPAITDEMVELCREARKLQREYYGDGSGLHLAMIDWARGYDAAAQEKAHD